MRFLAAFSPNSTVTATPSVRWLTQLVNDPAHLPVQLNDRTGRWMPAAIARTIGMPLSLAPTPNSGWWNVTTRAGSSCFTNFLSALLSGSENLAGPDHVLVPFVLGAQ